MRAGDCPKLQKTSGISCEYSEEQKPRRTVDLFMSICIAVNDAGRAIGEDHVNAKYTDQDVERVRLFRAEGFTLREISQMMDMPVRTIRGYLDGSRRNQSVAGWKVVNRRRKS